MLDGAYTEWYENGNLRIEANYKNDLLEGKYIDYYINGSKNQRENTRKVKEFL